MDTLSHSRRDVASRNGFLLHVGGYIHVLLVVALVVVAIQVITANVLPLGIQCSLEEETK